MVLLAGGGVALMPLFEAARWQASPEAERAQRNADVPTPVWLTPVPRDTSVVLTAPTPAVHPPTAVPPTPTTATFSIGVNIAPVPPTATPTASDLKLTAAAFKFMDPPEPGAAARLSVTVHNPTDTPSGLISLAIPLRWLSGYHIQATDPPLVSGSQSNTEVRLSFAGAEPQADAELSIDVSTVDEVIDAPNLTVFDAEGREVGRAHPPTQAPPARPGPIYSIDIPRLRLHAGVVPVEWEPPLFAVGQVRTSAFVTLGNSVLVGHVRGAAGYNVFDHLDQLAPGDEVIANSRGQPYTFVVSRTQVLSEEDASPTVPTSSARLTLMTCAGDWNPVTRDYPERLWVIAEPTGLSDEATQQQPPELRRLTAHQ